MRNEFEKKLARQIRRARLKVKYETERIPYVIAGHYIPDFILETPLGKIYIEAKGYFRPEAKRKLIAVKKQHPGKDLRIIFYSENKKYIAWAERYGFKWAIGKIPIAWFSGL